MTSTLGLEPVPTQPPHAEGNTIRTPRPLADLAIVALIGVGRSERPEPAIALVLRRPNSHQPRHPPPEAKAAAPPRASAQQPRAHHVSGGGAQSALTRCALSRDVVSTPRSEATCR